MSERATLFGLAWKSLLNRRLTAGLLVASVAMSVMLLVAVDRIRTETKTSFINTISGVDLVVGARGGPLNLLLYAVFRVGDATSNISWESYQLVAARPEVAWSVPLSLGDAHRGYRVLGTTDDYFVHYRYGRDRALAFETGKPFANAQEAVLGAEVAAALGYALGDGIVVSHGIGDVSFVHHDDAPFTVAGILAYTGTPVDRTVHVSLAGIEAMHSEPGEHDHGQDEHSGDEDDHRDEHVDDEHDATRTITLNMATATNTATPTNTTNITTTLDTAKPVNMTNITTKTLNTNTAITTSTSTTTLNITAAITTNTATMTSTETAITTSSTTGTVPTTTTPTTTNTKTTPTTTLNITAATTTNTATMTSTATANTPSTPTTTSTPTTPAMLTTPTTPAPTTNTKTTMPTTTATSRRASRTPSRPSSSACTRARWPCVCSVS